MAVLWNQGLREVGGRVIDSKGVRCKVFKNVLVRQVSAIRYQASGKAGMDSKAVLVTGVPVEHVSILLGR